MFSLNENFIWMEKPSDLSFKRSLGWVRKVDLIRNSQLNAADLGLRAYQRRQIHLFV